MNPLLEEMIKIKPPSAESWQALALAANDLKFGNCWENCASYCCRTNNKNISFSLMKCNSAGMVFPLEEYRFLEKKGVLQKGFKESARFHRFQFCSKRNLSLNFVTAVCDLGGLCSIPEYRPMICKLYPHYPIPNPEDGSIQDFIVGSVIDQYWSELNIEHPCWLHRVKGQEVSDSIKNVLEEHLTHPYILFYYGAAAIFVRHVSKNVKMQDLEKFKQDPLNFFRNWEIQYLMGKYIESAVFKEECCNLYDKIVYHHGEFEL